MGIFCVRVSTGFKISASSRMLSSDWSTQVLELYLTDAYFNYAKTSISGANKVSRFGVERPSDFDLAGLGRRRTKKEVVDQSPIKRINIYYK